MAIKSLSAIKQAFETGKRPTQQDFQDLVDTLAAFGGGIVDWDSIPNKPDLATEADLQAPQAAFIEFDQTGQTVIDPVSGSAVNIVALKPSAFKTLIENYLFNLPGDGNFLSRDLSWQDGGAPLPKLTAPVLSVILTGETSVTLQQAWGTQSPQSSTIQYATDANFTNPITGYTGNSASPQITGLAHTTDYYFRSRISATGYQTSDWSATLHVKTATIIGDPQLPAPAIALGTPTSSGVSVTITPVSNANNYVIERDTVNTFANAVVGYSGAGLTPSLSGLAPSTTYYVRGKAQGPGYMDSPWGEIKTFTTAAASGGDLLPGYTYRDVLPQVGEGAAPFNATNHVFDFTGRASGDMVTYSPNLMLTSGVDCSIAFMFEGGTPTSSISYSNNNTYAGTAELGINAPTGPIYTGEGGGNYLEHGAYTSDTHLAFERSGGTLNYVKYVSGVRTVIRSRDIGTDPVYINFLLLANGAKLKHLQFKGAVIVDNAGAPI